MFDNKKKLKAMKSCQTWMQILMNEWKIITVQHIHVFAKWQNNVSVEKWD